MSAAPCAPSVGDCYLQWEVLKLHVLILCCHQQCVCVVNEIVDGVITTGPFIQHPLTSSVSTEPLRGAPSAPNHGTRQVWAWLPVCTQYHKKNKKTPLYSFFKHKGTSASEDKLDKIQWMFCLRCIVCVLLRYSPECCVLSRQVQLSAPCCIMGMCSACSMLYLSGSTEMVFTDNS